MITLTELFAPIGQFERLVDEQYLSALGHEAPSKIDDTMSLKIKTVEIDVQALTKAHVKVFLGVLQQEGSASHTARSFYAYHAITPINGIHQ